MGSKFFDIPFRTPSSDSDFNCKDGELDFLNVTGLDHPDTLPAPDIDFTLVRTFLPGWHINPEAYPSKTLVATNPSMEYWTPLAGSLLKQFESEAQSRRLFVAPVYVLAAWRSTSGSYINACTPQLLIPNSEPPLVATDGAVTAADLLFKIAGAVCSLYFRIKAPEVLRDFVGKISGLEIFVSNPLQKYDTYNLLLPSRNVITNSWCRSLDISSGIIADRRICSEMLALAWKASYSGEIGENSDNPEGDYKNLKFYPFAGIPLREVDRAYDWMKPEEVGTGLTAGTSLTYSEILNGGYGGAKTSTLIIHGKGENIDIMTRPLKLSGAGEFKQVRSVHLRGTFEAANITLSVFGSRDMRHWWLVAKRRGGAVALLPRSSFRFLRIGIEGHLPVGQSLHGVTIYL